MKTEATIYTCDRCKASETAEAPSTGAGTPLPEGWRSIDFGPVNHLCGACSASLLRWSQANAPSTKELVVNFGPGPHGSFDRDATLLRSRAGWGVLVYREELLLLPSGYLMGSADRLHRYTASWIDETDELIIERGGRTP